MNLQPLQFDVNMSWRWRRDAQYDGRDRWVLQRCCMFVLTTIAAGEEDVATSVSTLLSHIYVRQPHTTYMNTWQPPNLVNQPTTIYSRATKIEGSDYENLDPEVYDWKVTDAFNSLNESDQVWRTVFIIQGQWDKFQGVAYGVVRREKA